MTTPFPLIWADLSVMPCWYGSCTPWHYCREHKAVKYLPVSGLILSHGMIDPNQCICKKCRCSSFVLSHSTSSVIEYTVNWYFFSIDCIFFIDCIFSIDCCSFACTFSLMAAFFRLQESLNEEKCTEDHPAWTE